MGEYQGRRRGRPEPESEPGPEQYQDPDPGYGESPYRHYESYDEGYGLEPQYAPGYTTGNPGYPEPDYAQPGYPEPGHPTPSPYGGDKIYAGRQHEFYEPEPAGYDYPEQPHYELDHPRGRRGPDSAVDAHPGYAEQPYPDRDFDEREQPGRRGRRGARPAIDEYYDRPDGEFAFPEQADHDLDYAEPRFERVNRRAAADPRESRGRRGADEARADLDFEDDRDFDDDRGFAGGRGFSADRDLDADRDRDFDRGRDRESRPRETPPRITTPIATAAATLALLTASFVSAQAVAAVTAALQMAVAWAVLNLLDLPSRRAAVIAVLPALAADAGTFAYSPDVGATAVAAAIGCGFVLAAADTVLTSRRRGVEPGASRDLAAVVIALVFTGMTALYVAAARLDHLTVAAGAVLAAVLALGAARSRLLAELSPSGTVLRSMAVGLPFAAAAVASYAAAILVA